MDYAILSDVKLSLEPQSRVAVVGPNGAGKSTLFKMITGSEEPNKGSVELGETVKLAYVDQSRDTLNSENTIYEEIAAGSDIIQIGKKELNARAWVSRFGFKGTDQQKKVGLLSGGERNRVHLAKVLKGGHNLLLLDEVRGRAQTKEKQTAHLSSPMHPILSAHPTLNVPKPHLSVSPQATAPSKNLFVSPPFADTLHSC